MHALRVVPDSWRGKVGASGFAQGGYGKLHAAQRELEAEEKAQAALGDPAPKNSRKLMRSCTCWQMLSGKRSWPQIGTKRSRC